LDKKNTPVYSDQCSDFTSLHDRSEWNKLVSIADKGSSPINVYIMDPTRISRTAAGIKEVKDFPNIRVWSKSEQELFSETEPLVSILLAYYEKRSVERKSDLVASLAANRESARIKGLKFDGRLNILEKNPVLLNYRDWILNEKNSLADIKNFLYRKGIMTSAGNRIHSDTVK